MTARGDARIAIVVNPTKVGDDNGGTVEKLFADHGLPAPRWYPTTEDDPGRGQAQQALADGCDLVVAQGGDGTVRACAAALAGTGMPLGLLPAGTGNLLARNLDIPRAIEDAVEVLASGADAPVDVLTLDDEPFVVMGGSGFDALLFDLTSEDLKSRAGWAAYVVAGARALRRARAFPVELTTEHGIRRERAVGVVVGNVGTLTAGIELLPEAEADDGALHIAVLSPLRWRDWAGLAVRLVLRREPKPFQMTTSRATELEVSWPRELSAEIDGDLVDPRSTLRFGVQPAGLVVRVPAA